MSIHLRVMALSLLAVFVFSTGGQAEEYKYKDYTVKKGDTLWDISRRELEDNFQWPMIWKENLRINNPDLIYPGQVIKIPIGILSMKQTRISPPRPEGMPEGAEGVEAVEEKEGPEVVEAAPAPEGEEMASLGITPMSRKLLALREMILEAGYISKKIPFEGEITSSHTGRNMFGVDDLVYIKTVKPTEAGVKFYVIKSNERVKHPVTGKYLGNKIRVSGTLVTEEAGTSGVKARIIESFDVMAVGDPLDIYYEVESPFNENQPPRRPDISGVVISSKYARTIDGFMDFVFIDKGSGDGLMLGDVVSSLIRGVDDRKNGELQIVNLRETTSLARIIESVSEIKSGDVIAPDK